jgi:CRISPR/Cas system-associated endonuclease Cas3-HD
MTAIERFEEFFTQFRTTDLWLAMKNTHEDSPWHRESSVAEHTRMLIRWYKENLYPSRSETQRLISMVACVFHDTGKPPAQIVKHSPERGEYRAYHGHEQLSARIWTDYAASNTAQMELLKFSMMDVANIALMLEHHVPFALNDKNKRSALKTAFLTRMGEHGHRAWLDLLLSDQHGRISDGQAENLAIVDQWMIDWDDVKSPAQNKRDDLKSELAKINARFEENPLDVRNMQKFREITAKLMEEN